MTPPPRRPHGKTPIQTIAKYQFSMSGASFQATVSKKMAFPSDEDCPETVVAPLDSKAVAPARAGPRAACRVRTHAFSKLRGPQAGRR
jgi:hypothetical protein